MLGNHSWLLQVIFLKIPAGLTSFFQLLGTAHNNPTELVSCFLQRPLEAVSQNAQEDHLLLHTEKVREYMGLCVLLLSKEGFYEYPWEVNTTWLVV